jgi:phage head maturation protease
VNTFKIFAPMLKASMGPDGKMRLHGIASSTVKDRHGDTMQASALSDMERSANQNLTIFLNHEYRVPEDVAGHVERALIRSHPQDPDIHDLSMDIVINDKNERAVKAWEAIDGGTQLGLSIGAMIPEGGATRDRKTGSYQIDHVELLETSLVGVPANPRSWVEYAVKSLGGGVFTGAEMVTVGDHGEEEVEILREIAAEELEHTDDPAEDVGVDTPQPDDAPGEPVEAVVETPDISNATVSVETPFANITIDTGNRGGKASAGETSQEAPVSAPETEDQDVTEDLGPWAGILPVKSALIDPDVQTALQMLEPSVVASLRNSTELLKAITRELIDTKAALASRNDEYAALEAATSVVVTRTAEILDKLSNTPVGRRAVVRDASDKFAGISAVYSEEFLTLLKKGQ